MGNGRKASFWTSRWLHGEALAACRLPHNKRKNRTVADAITNNRWITDIDHNLNHQLIAEYVSLWEVLENVILIESQQDNICWVLTADGKYTAKSAYSMQFEGKTHCVAAVQTWKTRAPPRCKFFVWLMLQDRIWTAARLQLRGWPNEYFCQLRIRNLETTRHLFCECQVATKIWEEVANWIQAASLLPENWNQTSTMAEWCTDLIAAAAPSRRSGMQSMVTLTIWEIWRERNNRVFRNEARTVRQIVHNIQDEARTWRFASNKGLELLLPAPAVA